MVEKKLQVKFSRLLGGGETVPSRNSSRERVKELAKFQCVCYKEVKIDVFFSSFTEWNNS